MNRLVGFAFFMASLAVAAGALGTSRGPAEVDHPSLPNCISEARYHHPLDDKHQELVNALYACGVYEVPVG